MLTCYDDWRREIEAWWDGPLPTRPDFGERYPWTAVALHAMSKGHRRKMRYARQMVDEARQVAGADWWLSLSAGKDSTALAVVVALTGWRMEAMSLRDSLCWPGEERYLDTLCEVMRLGLTRVQVDVDPMGADLLGDTESQRGDSLSGPWFKAANRAGRGRSQMWGLRAGENTHRRIVTLGKGQLYRRKSGSWASAPIARWTALDVHACLAAADIPIHPVYLCIDPGRDSMEIRHSWWVHGGHGAGHHYTWLRRWWPALWEQAVEWDPNIQRVM